jgi:RNase P/RNase MRP subunit POP5
VIDDENYYFSIIYRMKSKDNTKEKSKKLKPLSPSLRIKSRYVGFEVIKGHSKNIVKIIEDKCKYLYGIIGFAEMDFRNVKVESNNKNLGVIMVNRKSVDKLKACFVFLEKDNISIVSRYVSGSLKKIKEKLKLSNKL